MHALTHRQRRTAGPFFLKRCVRAGGHHLGRGIGLGYGLGSAGFVGRSGGIMSQ